MAPTPRKQIGFRKHDRHLPDFGEERRCAMPYQKNHYRCKSGQKERDAARSNVEKQGGLARVLALPVYCPPAPPASCAARAVAAKARQGDLVHGRGKDHVVDDGEKSPRVETAWGVSVRKTKLRTRDDPAD